MLAGAGCRVRVFEGADCIGGGVRTAQLPLPGFLHDICSAIHPMAASSPCFESFDLPAHGLQWVHSPVAAAHPFDDGSAVLLYRSIVDTARGLGADGAAWERVFGPGAAAWSDLRHDLFSPLIRMPRHPIQMARFGIDAVRSARGLAESAFRGAAARALFAGSAAHSTLPLEAPFSASFGMVLIMAAHAVGWPFPRSGSQRIADALAGCLRSHGGNIVTGYRVTVLPNEKLVLGDVSPREMLAIAGARFPASCRQALAPYPYAAGPF